MKQYSLTEEVRKRICSHMNSDHKDALNLYARIYGGIEEPLNSEMVDIDHQFLTLLVDSNIIKIRFNPP